MASIKNRLKILESVSNDWSIFDGKYYDELPEHLKDRYCSMLGQSRAVIEKLWFDIFKDLHFRISPCEVVTDSEIEEIRKEFSEYISK